MATPLPSIPTGVPDFASVSKLVGVPDSHVSAYIASTNVGAALPTGATLQTISPDVLYWLLRNYVPMAALPTTAGVSGLMVIDCRNQLRDFGNSPWMISGAKIIATAVPNPGPPVSNVAVNKVAFDTARTLIAGSSATQTGFPQFVVFVDANGQDNAAEGCSRYLKARTDNALNNTNVPALKTTQVVCYLQGGMAAFCQPAIFTKIVADAASTTAKNKSILVPR